MPVIKLDNQQGFPRWADVGHYGINTLNKGDIVEPHYHNANEYWIIISGAGNCMTEGDTYALEPGDIVLTRAGDEHSLLVTQDMVAVYFYGPVPEGAEIGHLHQEDKHA
jgi:quercetin dioxygenase-like cupin family protein